MAIREIPAWPVDFIRRQFDIAPIRVTSRDGGGFRVRVAVALKVTAFSSMTKFDAFICTATGEITSAPRGYAKNFRPGRITGLADAVEES